MTPGATRARTYSGALLPFSDAVSRTVAGTERVDRATLARKLGPVTWTVYLRLCTYRDFDGRTLVRIRDLRRVPRLREKLTADQVKGAIARLTRAGLVVRRKRVKASYGEKAWLVPRTVLGAPNTNIGFHAVVPVETSQWLRTAGSGGVRPGAGRERLSDDGVAPKLVSERERDRARRNKARANQNGPFRANQTAPSISSSSSLRSSLRSVGFLKEEKPERAASVAPVLHVFRREEPMTAPLRQVGPLGIAIGGKARPRPPERDYTSHPAVPRRVYISSFAAVLPSPPTLVKGEPDARHAFLVARAYVGAVEKAFKCRVWTWNKKLPIESKHAKLLLAAAKLLIAHDIAPAAWAMYSCDLYQALLKHGGLANLPKKPSLSWMFGPRRIVEMLDAYEGREKDFCLRITQYTDLCKELMAKQERFWGLLSWKQPATDEAIEALLVEVFGPGGASAHAGLVAECRKEAKALQADLCSRANNGVWIWDW